MNMMTNMENGSEFTAKQLEAQEAMQETVETAENTPEYWSRMAEQELNENGESDAYREYMKKAADGNMEDVMVGGTYRGHTYQVWLDMATEEAARGNTATAKRYKENAMKAL